MDSQKEKEKLLWRQQKHEEIKQELLTNEIFMKYIEKGNPLFRERFIDDYAAKKVNLLEWGPDYVKWNERDEMQWIDDATKRLKEIQQKKLFDLQCLWRAEKISLEEITLTCDFDYWEKNIFSCPCIEPVNESDVEMYIQYLQSENFENEQGFLDSWQEYDEIKEAYLTDEGMRDVPEWYEFHNSRTGLSVYLQLPDIRGDKEEYYLKFWRKEFHAKADNEQKIMKEIAEVFPLAETEKRPSLDYFKKGWMTWFVNTFEDKPTQEAFARYGGEIIFADRDEYLEDDLELLATADRIVPMQGWFDWREAVHKAADGYRREKIIEALPIAYQQYRVRVDTELGFELKESRAKYNSWYYDMILRGRELSGEKRDLNF